MQAGPPIVQDAGRRSHALESLTSNLRTPAGLHLLDFGAANQANIDFFTGLGHRLYSEDLLRSAEAFFTPEEMREQIIAPARMDSFLGQSLNFPNQSTDGALLWDALHFLPSAIHQPFVERLHRILGPSACVLAIFHPEAGARDASPHHCRVLNETTLLMSPRPLRRPVTPINNRGIERLFHRFSSVKFFLTRDHLREVLVRR